MFEVKNGIVNQIVAITIEVSEAINAAFGSLNGFKEAFTKAAMTRFGSGWAWLCADKDGKLGVCSTAN